MAALRSPAVVRALAMLIAVGTAIFWAAGRLDLPLYWVYLAELLTAVLVGLRVLDADLIRERVRPGPGGKDRALRRIALPFIVAHWIVAALDVGRFHWSDTVPWALRVAGLVSLSAGLAFSLWAMAVNRFFSPVVRIQSERDHHLIDTGPYRFVRHPGYAGSLLGCAGGALALGSWWSTVPVAGLFLLILRRVVIEDRFLHSHLDGYVEYAGSVRYRLIPGLW